MACAVQAKGVKDAGAAAFRVSGMELGGLFGSLLAGRISDKLIANNPKGGNVGKRVQVRCQTAWSLHLSLALEGKAFWASMLTPSCMLSMLATLPDCAPAAGHATCSSD